MTQETNPPVLVDSTLAKPTEAIVQEPVAGSVGDWVWCWLMDWCKKQNVAPATFPSLFAMVKDARGTFDVTTAQPAPVQEPAVPSTPAELLDDRSTVYGDGFHEGRKQGRSDGWDAAVNEVLSCTDGAASFEDALKTLKDIYTTPSAQPAAPLTDAQLVEHGKTASQMMAKELTRFDAACEVMAYMKDIHAPGYYMHRMSIVLHGNTEGKAEATHGITKGQP